MDKKPEKLVPEVRFKGFTDDWEQRKFLDEIDSIIDYRGKTPKKLGMSWSKTGYLALSALNVKNGWIDKESNDSHFGNQALYDIWMKSTPLYKGQVVFTTEAPMGNVAQIPDNEKYILSQRTIAFNPSQRLIDGFLADLLSTKKIQNELMSLATGGTAKGVSQKSLKFLKIAFPNTEEQNFIHKVIKLLQTFITLQQRKLRQLKQLKMVMLQQLFVDKNNQQPNLRFKKFNGNWELHKLGDVILDYKKKNNNDLLPVLTSSFQGIEYQEKHFGSKQKHDTSDYNVLPKEYMTYRNRSDNGYFRFNINKLGIIGIVSKFYPVFTTINTNKQFLASYLNYNPRLKNYFKVVSVGTSQHVLSLKNFKKTNLLFPSKSEQDKIGDFFNLLNKIIFLQQNKLTQLTTLKKYLLQKMFI